MKQRAFTLIELSIVLVIIGLIVGGVLVGKDLIQVANRRSVIKQVDQLKLAINTFRLKYNCLPGDCTNGSSFGFTAPIANGTFGASINGDGNQNYLTWPNHAVRATDDLRQSGLWTDRLPSGSMNYTLYFEGLRNSGGAYIFTNDLYTSTGTVAVNGKYGNTINLASYHNNTNGLGGEIMTGFDAYSIDQKIDDGAGSTGKMMGLTSYVHRTTTNANCLLSGDYDFNNSNAYCRVILYW